MSARPQPSTDLPVEAVLPAVTDGLAGAGRVVLEAPPGAGKTTRVPLALLASGLDGRLVLLEPRRVAARAAARRLAEALGESVGGTVGLTTRDDRRTSRRTRIEVVTEGVLLRRLQRDPALDGVGTLFFDEFHERNLESDLALAFALESRSALRDDLRVLVASATLDGGRVAALLAGPSAPAGAVPVVRASGRRHAVTVEHRDRPAPGRLADAVADAVARVLVEVPGDVLVFLPGVAEISRSARELGRRALPATVDVRALHGRLPAEEQDRALSPAVAGRRKVVLATDVAESSLTIEGVRVVVDAGLAREPRFDPRTGMTGLVTVPASRAAAEQRSGRAGRTAPGHCVRLWPATEHPSRDAFPRPAIRTDDLTGAVLEVAAWGAAVEELALLDQPDPAGWYRARETLTELGALDGEGRITRHGRRLAGLPVHPRIGQLLVRGRDLGLGSLAVEIAAVLGDRDPVRVRHPASVADLGVRLAALRGTPLPGDAAVRPGARARLRREVGRLERACEALPAPRAPAPELDEDRSVGVLVALGWPDRVGQARGGRGSFLLANGRGARLPDADVLADEPLLAVAAVDRGEREARIHLAAPLDPEVARELLEDEVTVVEEVAWRAGDVVTERREQFGALVLRRSPLADPAPDAVLDALLDGLREQGLGLLGWSAADRQLQARAQLVHRELGAPWPDVSDAALTATLDTSLAPFLLRARRRADLRRVSVADVVRARLPGGGRELDRLAPEAVVVPSGSRVRLDYTGLRPVLAVRLQELFGATTTPAVVDGRVPVVLHLLSPARRPVQITDDLAGFWERAYPQVRAELRGRYPKHAWPQDPRTARPLRGTRR
ncbi:ATP-dependent helicase HrpB [Egicoccus halophilus]|uniref:ATP-dependent helicase HrpB n=1 Tax=Egicoccus halophilus TaxID=1670830 RepID=A0A8J3EZB4_9ACTN|nr:ATP-dependent helicase HrpB [Egicoccus halophilus]GGI09617.1 ATP-dependent helicase HrpB [Egicoccus halophilus]